MNKTVNEIELLKIEELIKEINFLANKQKQTVLTDDELAYQKRLRNRYIEMYRRNLKSSLKSITVVDEDGNDVTPKKLKDIKNNNEE